MKLIIDVSSILGAFMHLEDKEFGEDITVDGKAWHVPSLEVCMERAFDSLESVLHEHSLRYTDCILVKDQAGTGAARKKLCPEYKSGRGKRPEQFYKVMNALVEEFCEGCMRKGAVTAVATVTPAVEADDLISEIVTRFPETTIWSRDRDMLAFPANHHIIDRELDPCKWSVPRELIILYRCLVTGDTSDNISSCKGFGPAAWDELKGLIGWPGLHELDKMFQEKRLHELAEDVPHMRKLQLLIDQAEDLYMSYKLMQPMHVPAHKVRWSARATDCSKVLVTAENFERCKGEVIEELSRARHVTLDYETSTPPESDAWVEQTDGGIKVDVISSEITGMSLKINDSTYYFSVDHRNTDNIKLKDLESILLLIKDREVYAQNLLNFENVVTHNTFGFMLENAYDTRIMANYCFENDFQGLKHLSKVHLNYDQQSYETTLAKASEESGFECKKMRDITGDQVLAYAIDDAITTDSIRNLLHCIMLYENTWEVFKQVEQKAGLVTSLAFCKGVDFDWDVYYRLKEENDANTIRAKAELESMLLEVGWGEKQFNPFLVLTGKTVKELYQMVMGYELETKARSVGSVVEAIRTEYSRVEGILDTIGTLEDSSLDRFTLIISAVSEGIEAVNALAEKYWVPRAELNTRSPTQVKLLLYDKLTCPVRIRNPATDVMRKKGIWEGSPSTDDTAIANAIAYSDTHKDGIAVLQKLVELKGYLTRESLFLAKYPLFCHWKTGKLHSNMSQSNTTTRRFTHSAANYAQLSKKKGKEMRDMLTVPKDWSIVALDESGQELRVAAWSTREPNFLSCYMGTPEQRRDVHSLVGLQIMLRDSDPKYKTYGDFKNAVDAEDPDAKSCRVTGKLVGFATQYLCRAKKLSQELCCSERDAQEFMEAKAKAFPRLGPAIDEWIELCRKRGYSETFLGARRHLHKQFAMKSEGEQASAGRLAWSFRVQGSSAEMIKLVMGYCWERGLIDEHCHLLTSIHDELVFAVHNSVLEERIPKLHACITAPYADMEIELESTPEVGTHFGSLKKYSLDKDK